MELTPKEFGNRLKLLRVKANLSQEEVANRLNTSQNIISRMEMGVGGTLTMAFEMLNYFRNTFSLDNFLADEYTIDSINTSNEIQPLESVAVERLIILRDEIHKELTYNIGLIKGEPVIG